MPKRKILSIFAAAAMTAAMLAGCADPSNPNEAPGNSAENNESILEKYEGLSIEEIYENLLPLSKIEFTLEVKKAFAELSQTDVEGTLPFAVALKERINEYSEQELIAMIKDPASDASFRTALVQIYSDEHGTGFSKPTTQGNDEIRSLLLDDSVDTTLRENIVILLDFSDEAGQEMLRSIAGGEEDLLAFQAIKRLNKINGEDALSISRDVLENYKMQTPEKVNAALKVMSKYYREMRIQKTFTRSLEQDKTDFIALCNDIINNYDYNEKLQDSAMIALSEMTDKQAITAVIENPNIAQEFKTYAVDQNYLTLTEMVESGSEEAIDTVCKAMEINPLKELSEPLRACKSAPLTRSADPLSEQILQEADKTIAQIQSNGTNANPKWEEFYNEVD